MGSSEFYGALEQVPEIEDALVVNVAVADEVSDELLLFVVVRGRGGLDEPLEKRVRRVLHDELSPRHVPNRIIEVADVPYTLTGKRCEVPVKRIIEGMAEAEAVDVQSLQDPESLRRLVAKVDG